MKRIQFTVQAEIDKDISNEDIEMEIEFILPGRFDRTWLVEWHLLPNEDS